MPFQAVEGHTKDRYRWRDSKQAASYPRYPGAGQWRLSHSVSGSTEQRSEEEGMVSLPRHAKKIRQTGAGVPAWPSSQSLPTPGQKNHGMLADSSRKAGLVKALLASLGFSEPLECLPMSVYYVHGSH